MSTQPGDQFGQDRSESDCGKIRNGKQPMIYVADLGVLRNSSTAFQERRLTIQLLWIGQVSGAEFGRSNELSLNAALTGFHGAEPGIVRSGMGFLSLTGLEALLGRYPRTALFNRRPSG